MREREIPFFTAFPGFQCASIPLRAARGSEDSDKTKTWMNACIRIQVFVFVCWTKSRDEIGRKAAYECGPQNPYMVRQRDIREPPGERMRFGLCECGPQKLQFLLHQIKLTFAPVRISPRFISVVQIQSLRKWILRICIKSD